MRFRRFKRRRPRLLDRRRLLDVLADDSNSTDVPFRLFALGRDASATIDSALLAGAPVNGFQNDGDNEITGIHVSDGNPRIQGILGAQEPHPFNGGWRVFYTQQHGDNVTYEILPAAGPVQIPSSASR